MGNFSNPISSVCRPRQTFGVRLNVRGGIGALARGRFGRYRNIGSVCKLRLIQSSHYNHCTQDNFHDSPRRLRLRIPRQRLFNYRPDMLGCHQRSTAAQSIRRYLRDDRKTSLRYFYKSLRTRCGLQRSSTDRCSCKLDVALHPIIRHGATQSL